jgi:hypothetical protein
MIKKSELAGSAFVAAKVMPDEEAQRVRLADEMDLPVEFVKRNYDKLTQKKSQEELTHLFNIL